MIYLSMAGTAVVSFQVRPSTFPIRSLRVLKLGLTPPSLHLPVVLLGGASNLCFWSQTLRLSLYPLFALQYSLAFSDTGSKFIGDLRYFALRNVLDAPSMGSTRIPASLFMICELPFISE